VIDKATDSVIDILRDLMINLLIHTFVRWQQWLLKVFTEFTSHTDLETQDFVFSFYFERAA